MESPNTDCPSKLTANIYHARERKTLSLVRMRTVKVEGCMATYRLYTTLSM